jgi:hypothetical protein
VANVDLGAVSPAPPTLCPVLDALRPFRSDTFVNGQALTAAQTNFAIMKQADGKTAGRAVVTVAPPADADIALLQLGAGGDLGVIAASRAALDALAASGAAVSKVPGQAGYRLQVDYAAEGLSSLVLLIGKGPFPASLISARKPDEAWGRQFMSAARAAGWRVEMAWYRIVPGGSLSVIPDTQTNALPATNALYPPSATSKPAASNAVAPATNALAAPPAKHPPAAASNQADVPY